MSPPAPRILIYLLRRDLRLSDNPVFHHLSQQCGSNSSSFTHVLPVYVIPANQVEVSGFLRPGTQSPYPEARSQVAGFWRCGPHRAKFLAESVWDLKTSLGKIGSDLIIRVGMVGDVLQDMLSWYGKNPDIPNGDTDGEGKGTIAGIWMTAEEGVEEQREERDARRAADASGVEFKLWADEKYFVDECLHNIPQVFGATPRTASPDDLDAKIPTITSPASSIPPQAGPFTSPESLSSMIDSLHKPIDLAMAMENPPQWPSGAKSAHPFEGGETAAQNRVSHLIASGSMANYKETRNGLLGEDYSTKLSSWLALGCVTARQVHASLAAYEDGSPNAPDSWKAAPGYGQGENAGTAAVRFELLWRDYMRLCTRKFGPRLFNVDGFRSGEKQVENPAEGGKKRWRYLDRSSGVGDDPVKTKQAIERFRAGRTGVGLIDASQRELFLTGYTSNRARQNVASFLASHLGIDWRVGAEWYECALTDYDLSNNWGNWQYVAGVGNDPRQGRKFNPVKQALDYDKGGAYIKTWVQELRDVDVDGAQDGGRRGEEMLMGLFQAWRLPEREKERLNLKGVEWVERPLVRIPFAVGHKGGSGAGGDNRRGGARGGRGYRGRGRSGRARRMGDMDRAAKPGAFEDGHPSHMQDV
ncbi:DNA photolyase, FAD-binding/Cryptochrome [Macrophomina phaseolina]|uniref:Cryptochrome DASH n=1 Tax=Macrophomina phaseolina TaxID=35725 RepID=A0ABQ8GUL9_9PEZI|nr:DNA photolyase, FAD-binding/Cryptochrome [Macrophomina phaseolina]